MAINYGASVKTARMTATRDEFAGGSLELQAADNTVLAVFDLTAGGGTIAGDIWTLTFDAATVSAEAEAGTGTTATKAVIKDSAGNADLTGLTVGQSGADVILDNTSIADGQNVAIASATIQHAA